MLFPPLTELPILKTICVNWHGNWKAYPVHAAIVENVGALEALMVPADYPKKLEANIPADFNDLPRLLGRASVRTCDLLFIFPASAERPSEGVSKGSADNSVNTAMRVILSSGIRLIYRQD